MATSFKTWEEKNQPTIGAVVNADDAKVIVEQFELSREDAEEALRKHGDLKSTLVALVNQ